MSFKNSIIWFYNNGHLLDKGKETQLSCSTKDGQSRSAKLINVHT